jgi:O-antigen ligase
MNLLIALFSIAALVWIIPLIQTGRIVLVAGAVLVVGTIFGPPFLAIDGPIQLSLDRLLWLVVIAIAIVLWRRGHARMPVLSRMDWLVIGVVAWFLASAFRGGEVPTGSSPTARWLFYIAMPAGMYTVARVVAIGGRDLRWMIHGSVVLGIYLAVTAILEISGRHGLVLPRFIVDPEIWEFYGRGRGPLLNPSANGFVMTISLVAAVIGLVHSGRRGKLIYAAISVVLLVGIYATLTRSAWLGACCAVGMVAMVYAPRWVRVLGLASIVILGGASLSGFKDQLIRMKRDKNLTASDAERSMKLRPLLAVVAWEMFQDHPLIGHGYGHYFEFKDPYHNDRSYGLPLEQARSYAQHNVFLSILVDTGLVGLSMIVAWLMMLWAIGWRLARDPVGQPEMRALGMLLLGVLTAYVCGGMFQDVMIIPMVHMFLFFVAGLGVSVYQRGLRESSLDASVRQPIRAAVTA